MPFAAVVAREMRYAKSHEYCNLEGDVATVGISDHAQGALGDVVYVEIPESGDAVKVGKVQSSSLLLSSLELSDTQVYAPSYEPSLEPLHIYAK